MTNANPVGDNGPTDNPLLPDLRASQSERGVVNLARSAGGHGHQAWIHVEQPWSSSLLAGPSTSKPALSGAHGVQVVTPWPMLTDQPNPRSSAAGGGGFGDLSLPQADEGASPSQASPGIVISQFARAAERTVDAVSSPSAWHRTTDPGMIEGSPSIASGSEPLLPTGVEIGQSAAASSTSSLRTNHGVTSVPSDTARSTETSASPGHKPTRDDQLLHSLVHHDPGVLRDLVQTFFTEVHSYWPILHVPSFDIAMASDTLLGSMLLLSSWVVGRREHLEIGPIVFGEVIAATAPVSVGSQTCARAVANTKTRGPLPRCTACKLFYCASYMPCAGG